MDAEGLNLATGLPAWCISMFITLRENPLLLGDDPCEWLDWLFRPPALT